MRRHVAFVAVLLAGAPLAAAQPDPGSADPEAAVRAVVTALFDGMRARDSAAVAATFHPEMRLMTVVRENETHRLAATDPQRFLASIASAPESLDERVDSVDVRVDDGLATAWMAYRFYYGGRFLHCGVNAMQLVQDAAGWRIVQIVDTRREGCE